MVISTHIGETIILDQPIKEEVEIMWALPIVEKEEVTTNIMQTWQGIHIKILMRILKFHKLCFWPVTHMQKMKVFGISILRAIIICVKKVVIFFSRRNNKIYRNLEIIKIFWFGEMLDFHRVERWITKFYY